VSRREGMAARAGTDCAHRAQSLIAFCHVIEEVAARMGDAPALLSDRESFTYARSPNAQTNMRDGRSSRALPRAMWSAC
jgi:hypothetical protein